MNFYKYEKKILKRRTYNRSKLNIFLSILILSIFPHSFANNVINNISQIDDANKKWCNFYYEKYHMSKLTDSVTGLKFSKSKFRNLAIAMAKWESGLNSNKIQYEPTVNMNAYGTYAILSPTARDRGWKGKDPKELLDPDINAKFAIKHFALKIIRYNGNTIYALASYNGGKLRWTKKNKIKNQKYIDNVYPIFVMINQYWKLHRV